MDGLMDFKETMRYLKTSQATLYHWAAENIIPAVKVGRRWGFNKELIDKWLDDHENLEMEKVGKIWITKTKKA